MIEKFVLGAIYYISEDGVSFETEVECLRWERFKQMPQFHLKQNSLWNDDYEWLWIYVKDEDDLTLAADALLNEDADKEYEGPEMYPAWVCIRYDPENDYFGRILGTTTQIRNTVNQFLKCVCGEQLQTINDILHQKYPEEQE